MSDSPKTRSSASRPNGEIAPSDFELVDAPMSGPAPIPESVNSPTARNVMGITGPKAQRSRSLSVSKIWL